MLAHPEVVERAVHEVLQREWVEVGVEAVVVPVVCWEPGGAELGRDLGGGHAFAQAERRGGPVPIIDVMRRGELT